MDPNTLRLDELFSLWLENETAEEVLDAIDLRSEQAEHLLRIEAARLPQLEIEDRLARLSAPPPSGTRVAQAIALEVRRAQRLVLEEEIEYRERYTVEADTRADIIVPLHKEVAGALMEFKDRALLDPSSPEGQSMERAHRGTTTLLEEVERGTPVVVSALRGASEWMDPKIGAERAWPVATWLSWALSLDLLSADLEGVRDSDAPRPCSVTRAVASSARNLFYGHTRKDPRFGEAELHDWPMDLPGDRLADLYDAADLSSRYWYGRWPWSELDRFLTPTRQEEPGRPRPHPQVRPEDEVRSLIQSTNGLPLPMLYPIQPQDRDVSARNLWTRGIPDIPPHEVAWTLLAAPTDPRVRWPVAPHPEGILCGVHIPRDRILFKGRPQDAADEDLFDRIANLASQHGGGAAGYQAEFRRLLVAHGYAAVGLYSPDFADAPIPPILQVVDPNPRNVSLIRESVPSFLSPARRLFVPSVRPS